MDEQQDERERSRSRDRHVDNGDDNRDSRNDNDDHRESRGGRNSHDRNDERNEEIHNLYITNLSFQTTDESLRAAFEAFGEVHNASVIKEPVTHTSRGFGFVSFKGLEDSQKALDAMHGGELDNRTIRVEKARRNTGYVKTPGVYLGPPQLASRPNIGRSDSRGRDDRQYNDRRGGGYDNRDIRSYGSGGGGYRDDGRGGGGGGGGFRGGYDRAPGGYRDDRYDMPPGGMRGDPRGGYDGYRGPPPRDGYRGGPPPMYAGDRRGPPGPVGGAYFEGGRGRSPPRMDSAFRGGAGRDRSRSPPPALDDRRGGAGFDRGGPPPAAAGGYGSGASAYGYRGPPRY